MMPLLEKVAPLTALTDVLWEEIISDFITGKAVL
jgi:hypothetical protein